MVSPSLLALTLFRVRRTDTRLEFYSPASGNLRTVVETENENEKTVFNCCRCVWWFRFPSNSSWNYYQWIRLRVLPTASQPMR